MEKKQSEFNKVFSAWDILNGTEPDQYSRHVL